MCETPIHRLPVLSRELGVDLFVKRDDLFPDVGGGNKARKMNYIAASAKRAGATALFTTGGIQSNHARATALVAAREGWRCHLVLHSDGARHQNPQGNYLLSRLLGASAEIVPPTEIAGRMAATRTHLAKMGEQPYEIPGGGHCTEGAMAYHDAMLQTTSQLEVLSWKPDIVICASGTGTTQAGLIAGCETAGLSCRIIGVSVARQNPRGSHIVAEAYHRLRQQFVSVRDPLPVEFRDEWVGGGYENVSDRVLDVIRHAARSDGLILDPTYTGKAFVALIDLINSAQIASGSRILFWHTGGLLNLLSATNYALELTSE